MLGLGARGSQRRKAEGHEGVENEEMYPSSTDYGLCVAYVVVTCEIQLF